MKGIEGTRLGRYELRCRVAQGGMSEVYLGYDRRVRRWVAVKVLYGSNDPFVRRFEREALAIGALSHEHILPLYDFGEQHPWYYLVMPYIEGGTLRDYLLKRERLTLDEAGSFLDQIALALQYAHDHGVVHRDVKPSNILLRPDGHAYLADFGLARAKIEAESLTYSGAMVGTPEYMAPEQSNGMNDYRSDLYSLGIILYQMLTGRVPFMADSPVAVTLKHIQTPPLSPTHFNSEIPPAIATIILKALAKNPEERFQHAHAFTSAYRNALHQEHVSLFEVATNTPNAACAVDTVEITHDAEKHIAVPDIDTLPSIVTPIVSSPGLPLSKLPRFPVGYETAYMPQVSKIRQQQQRVRVRYTLLLCSVLLLLMIPLALLWPTQPQRVFRPKNRTLNMTAIVQRSMTATALVHAREQSTLTAASRIQAAGGISSAIGAGHLLYYSDMTSNSGGWVDDGLQCSFSPQGYHVTTHLAHTVAWCYTDQLQFANMVVIAQAQLLRGDFCGLVFRLSPRSKTFYVLELNRTGQYRFQRAQGNDPAGWLTLIDWTSSHAITHSSSDENTFLVVATGSLFRFYINQQLIVSSFVDEAYKTGLIGLLVGEDSNDGAEAIFKSVGVFQK